MPKWLFVWFLMLLSLHLLLRLYQIKSFMFNSHAFLRIYNFQHNQWLWTKHVYYHKILYIDNVQKKKLNS